MGWHSGGCSHCSNQSIDTNLDLEYNHSMNKLILVRYGEHSDGHLNDQGKETLNTIAGKLKPLIGEGSAQVVSAKVVRAEESGELLSQLLGLPKSTSYNEFYSAEEDAILPNVSVAADKVNTLGKDFDTLIAIASREYIEQLPSHILNENEIGRTDLDRGEVLVIDYDKQSLYKL